MNFIGSTYIEFRQLYIIFIFQDVFILFFVVVDYYLFTIKINSMDRWIGTKNDEFYMDRSGLSYKIFDGSEQVQE